MDSKKHSSELDYANYLIDGLQKQLHGLERVLREDVISVDPARRFPLYDRMREINNSLQITYNLLLTQEKDSKDGEFTSNDFYAAQMVGKSFAPPAIPPKLPSNDNWQKAVETDLKSLSSEAFADKWSNEKAFTEGTIAYDVTKEFEKTKVVLTDVDDPRPAATFEQVEAWVDNINRPKHYTQGIETWDYISSQGLGYMEGNIIKYITRYKHKNGREDLLKAQAYLNKLLENVK